MLREPGAGSPGRAGRRALWVGPRGAGRARACAGPRLLATRKTGVVFPGTYPDSGPVPALSPAPSLRPLSAQPLQFQARLLEVAV